MYTSTKSHLSKYHEIKPCNLYTRLQKEMWFGWELKEIIKIILHIIMINRVHKKIEQTRAYSRSMHNHTNDWCGCVQFVLCWALWVLISSWSCLCLWATIDCIVLLRRCVWARNFEMIPYVVETSLLGSRYNVYVIVNIPRKRSLNMCSYGRSLWFV